MEGLYIVENPIKIHDLGGPPLFLETSIYFLYNQTYGSHGMYGKCSSMRGSHWENFRAKDLKIKNLQGGGGVPSLKLTAKHP